MTTALVIHGHFYQPPRENPWTGQVDRESSASPDHDWNERIHRECYRANAHARIFDAYGHAEQIVNNYAWLSFNFGPTLLSWMEAHDPDNLRQIVEADRASAVRNHGHGNAIAQAYNHAILPLCNERDRLTQVRWGLADFRHRFGREAESLWLPETAANDATLGTLIDHGLAYVILSPYQAERVRDVGTEEWRSVADGTVDPGVPYRYFHRDGSGRSLAVFFYDGPISRALAFEGLLSSSQTLVGRLSQTNGGENRLVHIATDGESYGHHMRFGERGLAHALFHEAPARNFAITNYGAFLAHHPPAVEVEIKPGPDGEGTAWSCAHGVGRWYRDCGCNTGAREGWNQAWRTPLRQALDFLRDRAAEQFESACAGLLPDPWAARDAYIELVLAPARSKDEWLAQHAGRSLAPRERERALTLLEMQRHAMLMYTSCGWFFADLSGIETVQILKYAGRVLDLIDELALDSPREGFLQALAEARSNLPEMGNGAEIFARFVVPSRVSMGGIAAHLAMTGLVDDSPDSGEIASCRFERTGFQKQRHGRLTLATSRIDLEEVAIGKRSNFGVAALHFGGVDFYCVAKRSPEAQQLSTATARLWTEFRTASLPRLLRIAQEELGPEEYGLEHLLPDGRQRISQLVFGDIVARFAEQYVHLYETNERIFEMLQEAGFELPKELASAAEFTLSRRFNDEVLGTKGSHEVGDYAKALAIAANAQRQGLTLDRTPADRYFGNFIADAVARAVAGRSAEELEAATALTRLATRLQLKGNLDRAQEILYRALETREVSLDAVRPLASGLGLKPRV